ncbi:MAG TPA: GvpL/GvpF family gas vesicle protein [Gemmatimonadaceae bacterium]|nr:GvpL/GvpF family gas vesicle protein [Gemmatimonadaceae bacterium]
MTVPPLLYAYAIVSLPEQRELVTNHLHRMAGIDAAPVTLVMDEDLERAQPMAVLVSAVDAQTYAPSEVESRVGQLEWLAPRAEAHDRVVTAAADAAPVIPLPIFSLFRDDAAIRGMLSNRREELSRLFGRLRGAREYTVRVYRDDARLHAALSDLSPHIRELESSATSASPGQRYLLQRKLDEARRTELRRVSSEVAQSMYRTLASVARGAVREPLPAAIANADSTSTQPAVLNASFLVDDARLDDFRRALSELIALRSAAGFRVDFTGPWPAYHFARESESSAPVPGTAAPDGEARDG